MCQSFKNVETFTVGNTVTGTEIFVGHCFIDCSLKVVKVVENLVSELGGSVHF